MKQLQLHMYGSIQGVGFRHWVKQHAQGLGLFGFAKNEPDGSVTILVQGSTKNLEKFLKMCYDGPSFAQITHVTPEWGKPKETFSAFEIL